MIALYILGAVFSLGLAIVASRSALNASVELGTELGISPFLLGVTVIAIGTDLPEIANSLTASASDHGDLNVGNSIGSVVTQMTLVVGLLCFSGKLRAEARPVIMTGGFTVVALVVGAALIADQHFGRFDAVILIGAWGLGSYLLGRREPEGVARPRGRGPVGRPIATIIGSLALVGAGAVVAVEAFARIAADLGMPEYLLSFFVLALGTSLPELVVDAQALRRSQGELAMGDLLGSSFVDASLSPAVGPLLFPTSLGPGLARGSLVVAVAVAVATGLLARDRIQRRSTGVILILMYAALYPALLT